MYLYDTLSREKKELPPKEVHPVITMYSCGPTVYDDTHIGHMRRYVMDDVLKRTLKFFGYEVKHVMNITDVGHLSGDDDSGEDKLEKGATKKGKTVWDIAKEYEDQFWQTMQAVNVSKDEMTILHATQCVPEMISIVQKLQDKGFTYETDEAVYFDVTKFENYGALSGQNLADKKQAVREEVNIDPGKKHPADFALWFKRVGRFADHTMHWESPWGDGFPGWHIECSAMSMKGLSVETIDIHTGGIDHIPVHHENEIAQSEAATGKPFVNWWVHHAFLQVEGEKMSKSKENFYTLNDILTHKINPLSLRLLFMQTSYRKPMNFTWDAARAAMTSFEELVNTYQNLSKDSTPIDLKEMSGASAFFMKAFRDRLSEDLNITAALGEMFYMLKSSDITRSEKKYLLDRFDTVLGLHLSEQMTSNVKLPEEILKLANERLTAKKAKDYRRADLLRAEIEDRGFIVEDTSEGYKLKKKS